MKYTRHLRRGLEIVIKFPKRNTIKLLRRYGFVVYRGQTICVGTKLKGKRRKRFVLRMKKKIDHFWDVEFPTYKPMGQVFSEICDKSDEELNDLTLEMVVT